MKKARLRAGRVRPNGHASDTKAARAAPAGINGGKPFRRGC